MSVYRLIAFDMDGTLLDSHKRVRESSLEALKAAKDSGKITALATGRGVAELREYEATLQDVDAVIASSGAHVYLRGGKNLYTKELPSEAVLELIDIAADLPVMPHILSRDSVMHGEDLAHVEDFGMGAYREMYERVAIRVRDIREYVKTNCGPIFKLNLYSASPDVRDILAKRVRNLGVNAVYSEYSNLECSPTGISKAEGLRVLCKHYGVDLSETIAVGDGDNDLAVLQTARFAVAMGNANERVKAVADAVVSTNDADGCAEAIYRYLLADGR